MRCGPAHASDRAAGRHSVHHGVRGLNVSRRLPGLVRCVQRSQRVNTILLTHPLRLLNVSIRDGQAWLNATEPR